MKQKIMMLATLMLVSMTMTAGRIIETKGDTIIIAQDGDTVAFSGTQTIKELTGLLDDTVINLGKEKSATRNGLEITPNDYDLALDSQHIWADVATEITHSIVWGLACLIFVILLFNYLKRRRKYKMVEKAIENNYPLPPYVFNGNIPPAPAYRQPEQVPVQGMPIVDGEPIANEVRIDENGEIVPPPFNPSSQSAPQQPVMDEPRMNWHRFHSSFVMVVVGLVFMFIFNNTFMMGAFSIVLLIGLGRGFIEYQDQRDAINAWRRRQ